MAEYISPYDLRRLTLERRRKQALLEEAIRKEEEVKQREKMLKQERLKNLQMQRELLIQQRRDLRVDRENKEDINPNEEESIYEYLSEHGLPLDDLVIVDELDFEEREALCNSTHEEASIAKSLTGVENPEKEINLSGEIERLDIMLQSFRHEDGFVNDKDEHTDSRDFTVHKEISTNEYPEQIHYQNTEAETNKYIEKDQVPNETVSNSISHRMTQKPENPVLDRDMVKDNVQTGYSRNQQRSRIEEDTANLEEEIATEMSAKKQDVEIDQYSKATEVSYTQAELLERWKELGKELEEVNNRQLTRGEENKGSEHVERFQTETKIGISTKGPSQPSSHNAYKQRTDESVLRNVNDIDRGMLEKQNSRTRQNAKVKTEPDRLEELQRQKDEIDRQLREETLERDRKLLKEKTEREEKIQVLKNYKEKKEREKTEQEKKREKQRQEEREIMARIERLKKREKDIDRKKMQKEELQKKSCEELEDQRMKERLRELNKEEEEIQKRIHEKEKKEKTSSDEKENKIPSETDVFAKLEKTILGKPYLPSFEGNQFEEWKLEVSCLLKSGLYPDYLIAQLVRNSLKGKTRRVLLTLQPGASAREILRKIESVYGNVKSGDSLIHDFYSAKQSSNESCTDWGIRIETLFYQAVDKGEVDESRKDGKLKERFWRGLFSERLKNATRVTYESSDSFEKLRKKARLEEVEIDTGTENRKEASPGEITEDKTTQPKIHQPIRTSETDSKLDMILEKMKALEEEVKELKRRQNSEEKRYNNGFSQSRGRARFRGNAGYSARYRGRGYRSPSHQNRNRNKLQSENERTPKEKSEQKSEKSDKKDKETDKKNKPLNG
ncbi:trichohyalin-like [Mercenaria mercenaria]|uniref:trichohyalin-like n=1 Tax=Mercenaria mercenaria TaxID=6596 RepID=UPI00234F7870|nr:trichohyalin-like [Mercenaria mercenaria]